MITAQTKDGSLYRVDGLANRGEWFGETWFIGIGCGFDIHRIVVEADNEQDAIDSLTDSRYGHLIKVDDPADFCKHCQAAAEALEAAETAEADEAESLKAEAADHFDLCVCTFAGNEGDRVNLDEIRILERVKVDYFAKPDPYGERTR